MGVNCIIAGGMGPRVKDLFAQSKIEPIIGVQGQIEEVIEKFLKQELETGKDLCGHPSGEMHDEHKGHFHPLPDFASRKIAISAAGKDLEAEVDPAFGRAAYFLIVNPETMEFEAIENPNKDIAHGAGIKTAELFSKLNVDCVLTGNCGPNASRILESAGIKVITGARGNVKEAISKFISEAK